MNRITHVFALVVVCLGCAPEFGPVPDQTPRTTPMALPECPGLENTPGVSSIHWNPTGQYCWITCVEGLTACGTSCLSEEDLHTNEHCGSCEFYCEGARVCTEIPATLALPRRHWACAQP